MKQDTKFKSAHWNIAHAVNSCPRSEWGGKLSWLALKGSQLVSVGRGPKYRSILSVCQSSAEPSRLPHPHQEPGRCVPHLSTWCSGTLIWQETVVCGSMSSDSSWWMKAVFRSFCIAFSPQVGSNGKMWFAGRPVLRRLALPVWRPHRTQLGTAANAKRLCSRIHSPQSKGKLVAFGLTVLLPKIRRRRKRWNYEKTRTDLALFLCSPSIPTLSGLMQSVAGQVSENMTALVESHSRKRPIPVDDVRKKAREQTGAFTKSYPAIKLGQTVASCSGYFAESQMKTFERDCENGCETLFVGKLSCRQPVSRPLSRCAVHMVRKAEVSDGEMLALDKGMWSAPQSTKRWEDSLLDIHLFSGE